MASTDFVVEQVAPVAAPAVEAAAGAEGPASAPLVEAAPVVEGPSAAPVADGLAASPGVEGLAAVVQALNAAAALKLVVPNHLKELIKTICNNVEYAASGTDVQQSNYEKLNMIERRSMNQHVEVHEALRQIQTAVDVYKHEVADVSWFSL